MFFLLSLLALGTLLFLLVRHGQFGPTTLASDPSPEADAKKILAERFARGDITSDEFMERASVLNCWAITYVSMATRTPWRAARSPTSRTLSAAFRMSPLAKSTGHCTTPQPSAE